jgi:hypothetical protein
MTPCPSRESLQGLLDECLERPALEEIVIHIEICVSCQELLEDLTRGLGWKSTMPDLSVVREPEIEQAIEKSDPAGGGTLPLVHEFPTATPMRTTTQIGPSDGALASGSRRAHRDWPTVPGYEIVPTR